MPPPLRPAVTLKAQSRHRHNTQEKPQDVDTGLIMQGGAESSSQEATMPPTTEATTAVLWQDKPIDEGSSRFLRDPKKRSPPVVSAHLPALCSLSVR